VSLFVIACVLIMVPLASFQALLTFKLLLAMQSLLQPVSLKIDFVVLCVLIMMPLASIQALHIFGSFIGDAIVVAARKCLC
jgi:hypothetical protein